jgi:hypothetical protein
MERHNRAELVVAVTDTSSDELFSMAILDNGR